MDSSIGICGMGAVTPYGNGINALWEGVLSAKCAISEMDLFDLGGLSCVQAGVIRHEVPAPPGISNAPRALRFAAAACQEAIEAARLSPSDLAETALVTASNFGDLDGAEPALIPPGCPGRDPAAALAYPAAEPAQRLAAAFGLGGVLCPLSLSCSSGASAVAAAAELIRNGAARRVVVVGFDAISRFAWSGLCSLRTMTKEKVRPFDRNRSGTVFSEGAAAVVLENGDSLSARQIEPLAWLAGWATGNNGHHLTAPAPRGAGSLQVMRDALAMSGLDAASVTHINAHGTGTKANDTTETQAIFDLFGERGREIPVTSVKGSLGHTLGAAGTVELAVAVLTLREKLIPPTANHTDPDPECPLRVVTSPEAFEGHCVLSNSAGFGGCNAALLITDAPTVPVDATTGSVITVDGHASVSALGLDTEEIQTAAEEGESACFELSRFEFGDPPPEVGEVPEFAVTDFGVAPKPYLDPASRYLLGAVAAAAGDILKDNNLDSGRIGISVGTAWGCAETAELFFADYMRKGPRLVKPFLFPHTYSNTAISLAAMEWSLKGPHFNLTAPESAGALAFAQSVWALRRHAADMMVAAATDALSPIRLGVASSERTCGEAAAAALLRRDGTGAQLLGIGVARDMATAAKMAEKEAGVSGKDFRWYANPLAAAGLSGRECVELESMCGETAGAAFLLQLDLALSLEDQGAVVAVAVQDSCAAVAAIFRK